MTVPDVTPLATDNLSEKQCSSCGELKPIEAFSRKRSNRNGYNSQCKTCASISRKRHYASHAEEEREKRKQYYYENHERELLSNRERYHSNKQYWREYNVHYYKANRDRLLAYGAEYSAAHRDIRRKWFRAFRATDVGKAQHRLSQSKRRAKKSGQEPIKQSAIQSIRLAQTDKKGRLICWACNKPIVGEYHLDHWVPLDKDGAHTPGNLHYMHAHCNLTKGAKHPFEIGRLL